MRPHGPNPIPGITLLALACALAVPLPALAAPCAGFQDVDGDSAFCSGVEWVRNRSITSGCAATQYCPGEPVTRLQMATFLARMGLALQPAFLHAQELVSNIPNDGSRIMCVVEADAASHPRTATPSSVVITHTSGGVATLFAGLAVSVDGGATWTPWSQSLSATTNIAGRAAAQSPAAPPYTIGAGQAVRFGIRPYGGAGGPLIEDPTCEMTVRLDGATGGSVTRR
jgi:hypothetical protein